MDGVQSIMDQTYQNIELIIINDGSPDNSAAKIKEIEQAANERFTRFVFVDRPNKGLVKTMNEGLSLAQGEYVATLPSDDAHFSESIETLVNFMKDNPDYSVAVGDNQLIDDWGKPCGWDKKKCNAYEENNIVHASFGAWLRSSRLDVDFLGDDFGSYKSLLKGNYVPNGYLMRKSVLEAIGGYWENAPVEDHILMLNMAKHGKMKYFDKLLYKYRWHESNMIKGMGDMQAKALANLMLEKEYCEQHSEYLSAWKKEVESLQPKSGLGKISAKLKRSISKRLGNK